MKINIDDESQSLKNNIDKIDKNKNQNENQNEIISAPNEQKNIRNSSFELLRIILMIFIISSHVMFHTKSLPKLDEKNFKKIICGKYIFLRIISNYGQLGDIIFIMITGYFSIKRLNFHYIKYILIATETYTYHYLFLYISNKLKDIYKDVELFKPKKGSAYFPLISSLGHWFTQHYLLLLIFMPFINTGLLSLNHKQYKTLVILILIFYNIIKAIITINKISTNVFSVTQLLKLLLPYIIGGYIRIAYLKHIFWKFLGIFCFILSILFEIIFDKLAINYNSYYFILINKEISVGISSILIFLTSFGIICLFKDIEFHSKIINFISGSVLGIYLIHANKNIAPFIFNVWLKTKDYNEDYYFFYKYFGKVFIVFIICLIIDIIRRYTIGLFIEIVIKFCTNLCKKLKREE